MLTNYPPGPRRPGMTRRKMLEKTCAGFGMLGLANLMAGQSVLGGPSTGAHPLPRAKRAIFLFLNGALRMSIRLIQSRR